MKQSLVTRKNRKLRKLRAALSRGPDQALLRARLRAARRPLRPAQGLADRRLDRPNRRGLPRRGRDRRRACASSAPRSPATTRTASRCSSARSRPACRSSPTSRARCRSPTPSTSSSSPATARADDRAATSGSASSRTSTSRSPAATSLLVDEVVDTGLTLHYLCRALALRSPESLAARRSSTGPTGGSSTTCRSATSASPSRTSSSPATASTSTSAGATCPTCTSSGAGQASSAKI